jgi:ATP-binding cassette subfamily F protein 3
MNGGYESSSSSGSTNGSETGAVEVAVQLSRFHMETIEGSATGDVDVRGLCLAVGDRELLADAHLALRRGMRYGLVGRNGCGKSTLLKAIANKSIPGLPRDMKVRYLATPLTGCLAVWYGIWVRCRTA